jgi:hypothetical protein
MSDHFKQFYLQEPIPDGGEGEELTDGGRVRLVAEDGHEVLDDQRVVHQRSEEDEEQEEVDRSLLQISDVISVGVDVIGSK